MIIASRDCARGKLIGSVVVVSSLPRAIDCARGKVIGSVVVVVVDTNSADLNIWASSLLVSATKRLPFAENWLQLLQIHSIPLCLQYLPTK